MCQPLFDGIREVQMRIEQSPHMLLCLDYDGTLTHYAATPLGAHLSAQMERVLLSVAENDQLTLAIVSGRDRADLQARVGIPGLFYAGNHGMEISGPGFVFVDHAAATHAEALQSIAERLTLALEPMHGALVEFKGLTLSVHYRQVHHDCWEEVRSVVQKVLAESPEPVVLTEGVKLFDIRPRVRWHKGTAVAWIKKKLARPGLLPVYVGDDVTDEDAFAAMPDGLTIRVGNVPRTKARYSLAGPAEVRKFLEWVDEALRHRALHHSGEHHVEFAATSVG